MIETIADSELDKLISRRAGQDTRPDPDELEPSYVESVRLYHDARHRDARAAWVAFHVDQAERIERAAAQLASRHRQKAEELMIGGTWGEGGR